MTTSNSLMASCPDCSSASIRMLLDAIDTDDLDRAIELGLLDFKPACDCVQCALSIATLVATRDARLRALAARDRFRAREARLAARAEARAKRRAEAQAAPRAPAMPALPPAAAAALARALAKASTKRSD
jgi:hypothetical protein